MKTDKLLRTQLTDSLSGKGAHVDWKTALAGLPAKFRGVRPKGAAHSAWELLEHMRIAQWDILEFSRDAKHVSPHWPTEYWPQSPEPTNGKAWGKSIKEFTRDVNAMKNLVANPRTDLFARIPHGQGQTIFREALISIDHIAYHVGQIVSLRQLLGVWK